MTITDDRYSQVGEDEEARSAECLDEGVVEVLKRSHRSFPLDITHMSVSQEPKRITSTQYALLAIVELGGPRGT